MRRIGDAATRPQSQDEEERRCFPQDTLEPTRTHASAFETGVMGASPHRLIVMLYQGARQAIAQARMHLQQGNMPARGEAISKAIQIVESGLQQSLNKEAGGEIAERLDALYTYMSRRLLEANMKQSEPMLVEVDGLAGDTRRSLDRDCPGDRADGSPAGRGKHEMTSNAEYFARYEAIAAISCRMLMAARRALWNDLVHLQDEYRHLVDALKDAETGREARRGRASAQVRR